MIIGQYYIWCPKVMILFVLIANLSLHCCRTVVVFFIFTVCTDFVAYTVSCEREFLDLKKEFSAHEIKTLGISLNSF